MMKRMDTQGSVEVETTRFGKVALDPERLVRLPEGLLGFPGQKNYIILEHKPGSPFRWLQSVDVPELAFVLMDPFVVKKDYLKDLPDPEKELFQGKESKRLLIFVLATLPAGKVEEMTVNLLGPLVIDSTTRVGRQVVLANSGYPHRHPVFPSAT
jgi:flagellar assembly factor FliW